MASVRPGKPLGRPWGSLNTPIFASAMAVLVGAWSISSIRSARRESAPDASGPDADASAGPPPRSYREQKPKAEQPAFLQQALKESREMQK